MPFLLRGETGRVFFPSHSIREDLLGRMGHRLLEANIIWFGTATAALLDGTPRWTQSLQLLRQAELGSLEISCWSKPKGLDGCFSWI